MQGAAEPRDETDDDAQDVDGAEYECGLAEPARFSFLRGLDARCSPESLTRQMLIAVVAPTRFAGWILHGEDTLVGSILISRCECDPRCELIDSR